MYATYGSNSSEYGCPWTALGGININIRILKLFEKKTKLMTSFVYILVYMETFPSSEIVAKHILTFSI